jgi:NAD(P)H dehydrogenase (quinone)
MLVSIGPQGELTPGDRGAFDASDSIIFGSPTYMGMASWQFEKFADATSNAWSSQEWKNKLAAGFTNSSFVNGDKHSTIHYFVTLAMQNGRIWMGTGLTPPETESSTLEDINYLGSHAGLSAQSPADANPEEAPPADNLATATAFERRIADVTKKLRG